MINYSNNTYSTLASGISNSDTSLTVATGEGLNFPIATPEDYFLVTLIDIAETQIEIVKVTDVTR